MSFHKAFCFCFAFFAFAFAFFSGIVILENLKVPFIYLFIYFYALYAFFTNKWENLSKIKISNITKISFISFKSMIERKFVLWWRFILFFSWFNITGFIFFGYYFSKKY